ncbi:MAG: metallopeptidase family protein [Deltaproteobacteria bacterium]|nr:metallopeptidase family protein [Deltaproteobacteria bacterium]
MAKKGQAWQDLLDRAEDALADGHHREAALLCDRAALAGDDARYFAALLKGDVLLDLGEVEAALSSYDSVAEPGVEDPEIDCARGVALFELARFAEADKALRSALRGNPKLAEAHHTLGLIAEILGTGHDVDCFRQARRLDPQRFPPVAQLSRAQFETVVHEALADLPAPVAKAVGDVPVLVAEVPHQSDLTQADPPLSPRILGLFVGAAPPQVSVLDAPAEVQPTIFLFKRNLERACKDLATLRAEIRMTVLHEVGHALGLSEGELEAMGLE